MWHDPSTDCMEQHHWDSVGKKRQTHQVFPMAMPKCSLMGDFTNLYGIYIKPIKQLSGEPWKFFSCTAETFTHWDLNKMVSIWQTTFITAFSGKKSFKFCVEFHWFVPKGPIDYKSALDQVMAWHQIGAKSLPEPMLTHTIYTFMRCQALVCWIVILYRQQVPSGVLYDASEIALLLAMTLQAAEANCTCGLHSWDTPKAHYRKITFLETQTYFWTATKIYLCQPEQ